MEVGFYVVSSEIIFLCYCRFKCGHRKKKDTIPGFAMNCVILSGSVTKSVKFFSSIIGDWIIYLALLYMAIKNT